MNNRHRLFAGLAVALIVTGFSWNLASDSSGRYLSLNPSITQRFRAIPSESALADYCQRLSRVQGITGVSYREYSPQHRSALITVFYDPQQTSIRQIRLFIDNTRMLWEQEIRA